jgi:hypothetical protein
MESKLGSICMNRTAAHCLLCSEVTCAGESDASEVDVVEFSDVRMERY